MAWISMRAKFVSTDTIAPSVRQSLGYGGGKANRFARSFLYPINIEVVPARLGCHHCREWQQL
jgi:hypothetical protein